MTPSPYYCIPSVSLTKSSGNVQTAALYPCCRPLYAMRTEFPREFWPSGKKGSAATAAVPLFIKRSKSPFPFNLTVTYICSR